MFIALLDLLGTQLGDAENLLCLPELRLGRLEAAADWCLACPQVPAAAWLAANSCCRAWAEALPATCKPITDLHQARVATLLRGPRF